MPDFPLSDGPVYTDPVDVSAFGRRSIAVTVGSSRDLSAIVLEVQETADRQTWVACDGAIATPGVLESFLPAKEGRRFLRLRMEPADPCGPPWRVWWSVDPGNPGPSDGGRDRRAG